MRWFFEISMRYLINTISFRVLWILAYLLSLLPTGMLYATTSALFLLDYHLVGYRKNVVVTNLSRSFPLKKYEHIHAVMKDFYRSFWDHFAEILKSFSIAPHQQAKKIELQGFEFLTSHISEGRNVIAALGHCGNWELFNILPFCLPIECYSVYKPLRNKVLDKLMFALRSRFGMKLIPAKQVARHILSGKHSAALYLFLGDQCPRVVDENYRIEFLNQPTAMFPGIEKIGKASNSVLVYFNVIQKSRGKYRITCQPLTDKPKELEDYKITRDYGHLLEQNICQQEFNWLWVHRRWKR